MEPGEKIKLLVVFTVTLLVFVLLYYSSNPIERSDEDKTWLLRTQSKAENRNLTELLKRASMQDRTVILTFLNQTWASPGCVLDLFLESFQIGQGTKALLNHLVILTTDDQAYQHCNSKHFFCFDLTTFKLKPRRNAVLLHVLQVGYNILYTDADVMWFRNPLPHFDPVTELTLACNFYTGNPVSRSNRADGGFFYAKSNEISIEFFKYWEMARVLHPHSDDQSIFEIIKDDINTESLGLRIRYLDTFYFSSFCELNKDVSKVCTVHASCCDSTEDKIHDLRLVLDDWRNFTATSPEKDGKTRSSPSFSSWRAPSKCK